MMLDALEIQNILAQHKPLSDSTVKDYVVQILSSDDAYDDLDSLIEQLTPFWDDDSDQVARIVHAIVTAGGKEKSTTTTSQAVEESSLPRIIMSSTIKQLQQSEQVPINNPNPETALPHTSNNKKQDKRKERKQRKAENRKAQQQREEELLEDEASAWQTCQQAGMRWGGRGKGGRGEYAGQVNSIQSNIHLTNVTITLPNGTDLLENATMDIVKGHTYGLIGRNGVGKSTLLNRLARHAIPGMPIDMRILLVQQQMNASAKSAVEVLLEADIDRKSLLQEQEALEATLESSDVLDHDELAATAQRLGEIAGELDAIGADTAQERAMEILKGLQFTNDMITGPTNNLSGGWRMRLALARALFVRCDLLLLDECTNHLDLFGLNWLIRYLKQESDRTLILVSHDHYFLNAVCTDIIVMNHQKLVYHVGNYSDYQRQEQEKAAREAQILDAAERQRSKAQAFIQKQQANKKSTDPNKQRQAKMIREKKLDRIGNYREDGKRYKERSLKKLSEDHMRMAQKVQIQVDDPVIKMNFPNPAWPPGIGVGDAIVRLQDFVFGYSNDTPLILDHVTLSLSRGSKVALVGKNGCGKSTLVKLIEGFCKENGKRRGDLWVHPSLNIGHITQYSVEDLEVYADQTVVEYAEQHLQSKKASSRIMAQASGNIRQYLGAFGLGGRHALQKIGKLSGGERMRLCFATVLADEPQLLLLDESTNHVDLFTLESMADALNDYQGSVLMVSHNQGFLSGFCKELWVLENGQVTVTHSDTETFDEIFSEYRDSILAGKSLNNRRREQADRAKRATKQRTGAQQSTGLL